MAQLKRKLFLKSLLKRGFLLGGKKGIFGIKVPFNSFGRIG